jgi:hypothetical protein
MIHEQKKWSQGTNSAWGTGNPWGTARARNTAKIAFVICHMTSLNVFILFVSGRRYYWYAVSKDGTDKVNSITALTHFAFWSILALFNDASSTTHVTSNGRILWMTNWQQWKGMAMTNQRYYPQICLEGLRKNTRQRGQSGWRHSVSRFRLMVSLRGENANHYTFDVYILSFMWKSGFNVCIVTHLFLD